MLVLEPIFEADLQPEFSELMAMYAGATDAEGRAAVVRNGYLPEREVMTGVGSVSVTIQMVHSRGEEPVVFRSSLVPPYVRQAKTLDAALPWLYSKGVATGQMSETLAVLAGPDAKGLSAPVVSRLKKTWSVEYEAWCDSQLGRDRWVYLWADGIYSDLRADRQKLCALVVIGVNECSEKRFLAIEDGIQESTQSWREVLLSLKGRGLAPEFAVGDGALGFWAAMDEIYPAARHQRCWVHKTANVLNAMAKSAQPKAKGALNEIWIAWSREDAQQAFDHFIAAYGPKYPKPVHCLIKDREALLAFYDFPAEHWTYVRTTNPIELTFTTIRHRTNRTKGCVTRKTMLAMIYKLGVCAEKRWRRIRGSITWRKLLKESNSRTELKSKRMPTAGAPPKQSCTPDLTIRSG